MNTDTDAILLDQPAIARLLSISRATLRRLIIKGDFPEAEIRLSTTLLRWRRDTVEQWLAERATSTEGVRR